MKKVFFILIPILLVLLVGHVLRTEKEFFIVSRVPVSVVYEGHQEAMVRALKPQWTHQFVNLKGRNIWKIRLSQVYDEILRNDWVQDVELHRRLPDQIAATIRLKGISVLFVDGENKIFPITRQGQKLSSVSPTLVPVVPVLYNDQIANHPELLNKLVAMLGEVPDSGDLKTENIASVDLKPITGLQLNLINSKVTVHLGEKDISTKGLQVLRVTDYLKSQNQKARVIDASFTKKVLVRLRKGS